MTVLDFSAGAGLIAVMLTTANLCLGLMIAVRGRSGGLWMRPPINLLALHNGTAYLLLATIAVNVLLLLRLSSWHFVDLLWPLHFPVQPFTNTIGALCLYLIVSVVVTSYFRARLGRRRWKTLHFVGLPRGHRHFQPRPASQSSVDQQSGRSPGR